MNNSLKLVSQALETVIASVVHDESVLQQFFSHDYQQYVDDKVLNFHQFVSHMQTLKQHSLQRQLRIIACAAAQQTVFTRHRVAVTHDDGQVSEFEVMAQFELRDGKICRCHELTRQIFGPEQHRDLGSR